MTDLSKNNIKQISSLQKKKFRLETGRIFVEGIHLIEELTESRFSTEYVVAADEWLDKHYHQYKKLLDSKKLFSVSEGQFNKLCDTETPQGIGAVVNIGAVTKSPVLPNDGLLLYLDRIQDPGNLGTIFRTARWFGVNSIILSENSVEVFSPKVVRSSLGAVFHVDIFFDDEDKSILKMLKGNGFSVLAADMHGSDLFKWKMAASGTVLIIGSEAHGVDEALMNLSDQVLSIPKTGGGESLNAAVAAAIFLSHLAR